MITQDCRAEDSSCVSGTTGFDVLIKNGTVYDGTGGEGRKADVALRGDRIARWEIAKARPPNW
jgi:N-acyl-D-aspartate/D-glutamate deacylase